MHALGAVPLVPELAIERERLEQPLGGDLGQVLAECDLAERAERGSDVDLLAESARELEALGERALGRVEIAGAHRRQAEGVRGARDQDRVAERPA